MRLTKVVTLAALILLGSVASLAQEPQVAAIDYPLTAEEEWSNAMLYTDRLVLGALGGTAAGAGFLGACGWAVIKGFDLLLSLESPGMLRAGTGVVMVFGGALWARAGILWTALAGIQWSLLSDQRDELLAIGESQGWERQDEIVIPEDPGAAMRVDPAQGDPGGWIEWFKEILEPTP